MFDSGGVQPSLRHCTCRCHTSASVKHFVACCCVHRIKGDCPECSPKCKGPHDWFSTRYFRICRVCDYIELIPEDVT